MALYKVESKSDRPSKYIAFIIFEVMVMLLVTLLLELRFMGARIWETVRDLQWSFKSNILCL